MPAILALLDGCLTHILSTLGGTNLCFPPYWSVVNLFPISVSDFSPHGYYEVIGSVAQPSSVKIPKTLTSF